MFELAVKGRLPLIGVDTRDTVNVATVLISLLSPLKITPVKFSMDKEIQPDKVYYLIIPFELKPEAEPDYDKLYAQMTKQGSVLIMINAKSQTPTILRLGDLPVQKDLKKEFLAQVTSDGKVLEVLTSALGGCTLKEAVELACLTMARDKSLTPQGITVTRKGVFSGSQGLTQVDSAQAFYLPIDKLSLWVKKAKPMFFNAPDPRLCPRGILAGGKPGTGKTEGAKYIANEFGCPLFRIDVSNTKNKYVGESSANLARALSHIDNEEPCILLIDEIEKVFSTTTNDSSGTTSDMLSQLLWWLAEHKSKVLTVMTTNDASKLPKELWRAGRIDMQMVFEGLPMGEAQPFVSSLMATYKIKDLPKELAIKKALQTAFSKIDGGALCPQATLTEAVKDTVMEFVTEGSIALQPSVATMLQGTFNN